MSKETSTRRRFLELGGVALATGIAGCATSKSAPDASETASPTVTTTEGPTEADTADSPYTQVYQDAISSVTTVQTTTGQGTGFQYDANHVVTNAHVVGTASEAQVRFHDGTWASGSVKGTDPHSDLAVIEPETVPDSSRPLPFSDEPPTIGQEVVVIGNPYNLDGSVTSGIVSGTDRLIPSPAGYQIPDAIQTDAAVNPGNSGGPLMNLDGSVVGVVNSKQGDSIAFGISAALTRRVVPELIDTGSYEHAYMGVSLETMAPTVAAANDLDRPRGLLVVETVQGGPADGVLRASSLEYVDGARVPVGGDVIRAIEGTSMNTFEDLASYLALQTRPGETIDVTVLRDGDERTVELTLAARPDRSTSPLG
ncbi:Serine proteinase [Halorhabdus tiamatea SARL4B]|uniref:Peptidase S1 and S6 chymotrypsin/Hap family protein n=1 Tax=Halorhabdus tiamatea SARL4B TaxID=1033806 RepID=F7PKU4_9EURY|nr:trypsin-like peptidase domain-containing protein [Halorhabdus tiamatea]ERJ06145.1 Serine proteinase [Halorhabdus tiamatea SARL4B]CCQ34077.1 peptidase S1 and S6 chymotrypsin/Hap family protein [Halorhabdus tiamatea SARL4B]